MIFGDLPVTVVVGGASCRGSRSTVRREALLVDEGLRQQYRFSVYVRTADLSAVPTLRSTLTVAGVTYRMLNMTLADDGRMYRLDLGEQYAAR